MLTLVQVLAQASNADRQGEVARARHAVDRASGAVSLAEGAFDWSFRSSNGYTRVYQYSSLGGLLTTRAEHVDVLSTANFVERQLANGIRVRPGIVLSQTPDNLRPDVARALNRPQFQVDVPLDRSLGEPPDALRLQAARSDLAAAHTDSAFARQAYLHRVVTAVWVLVSAQEKVAVTLDLANRIESVAARIGRLASAGEAAAMSADELRARAALARSVVERDAVEVLAARMELAGLLRMEPEQLAGVTIEFPRLGPERAIDRKRVDSLVGDALANRPELRGQVERVEGARLRGRIGEREVDSQLSLTFAQDRLLVNWSKPLGENRRSGARQQSIAGIGAAEDAAEDLRQRIKIETRLAFERLIAARRTISRAQEAMATLRDRYSLVSQLVDSGRQPPSALADAADQLASISRQSVDARLLHAVALADLRRATGEIPDATIDPAELARLFVTEP